MVVDVSLSFLLSPSFLSCSSCPLSGRAVLDLLDVTDEVQGLRRLLVNNILSSFVRMSSPLFELEHQHRLDVGDIDFVQAVFRGTSPAQLHQRTISEQYCREHF